MKKSGFTLIEAIVATSVFAFVVSSIIGVYISALQIDRKTRAQREVTQNARYIMDFLAKEVRNGEINYATYPGQTADESDQFHLINQAGELEIFRRVLVSGPDCVTGVCKIVLAKQGGGTSDLTSAGVKVTKLEFRTSPTQDPFTPAKTTNVQPHVIVVMELTSSRYSRPQDQAKINVQSTFTVRHYPSRE